MIPDDAVERLMDSAQKIGVACESAGIAEWEIFASQGYGNSLDICLLYTSPSPRDQRGSRLASSA